MNYHCPGCHQSFEGQPHKFPAQPVVLNYRFATNTEASSVPKRSVDLLQCPFCGLIYNSTFDPELVPYDERYDNRQGLSPAFKAHLDLTAARISKCMQKQPKSILEVGCGKGDFLKLLCQKTSATGCGYDTTYDGEPTALNGQAVFYRQYLSPNDIHQNYDLLICRHVVEHVPAISDFIALLAKIAVASGKPIVLIETPVFEWIAANRCFWDIFYEHCNYFTKPALRQLMEIHGFEVLEHEEVFNGQYQLLLARYTGVKPALVEPSLDSQLNLDAFIESLKPQLAKLQAEVINAQAWAIWGAGAKGVSLANHFQSTPPSFVIDINPCKDGCYIPGTSIPVRNPNSDNLSGLELIIIANPNYEAEIKQQLGQLGYQQRTLTV